MNMLLLFLKKTRNYQVATKIVMRAFLRWRREGKKERGREGERERERTKGKRRRERKERCMKDQFNKDPSDIIS